MKLVAGSAPHLAPGAIKMTGGSLARLDAAGLVQTRPGRYTIVSPLDARSMQGAQAVAASMHELAAMRAANERFALALRAMDVDSAIESDDEFHDVAVEVDANGAVRSVLDRYTPLLRR